MADFLHEVSDGQPKSHFVRLKQKLEELAELRGWSVRKVAQESGLSQQTLHGAIEGADISVSRAIAVSRVMDVPVDWLFDDAKDWQHLPRNPFWVPPGLSLGSRNQIRKDFADDLNRYVQRQHGIEAEPPSPKSARPKNTDRPAAASGTSRKRRAAGS